MSHGTWFVRNNSKTRLVNKQKVQKLFTCVKIAFIKGSQSSKQKHN